MSVINVYKIAVGATTPGDAMVTAQLPRKGIIRQISIAAKCVIETDAQGTFQVAINRATGQFSSSVTVPCQILGEVACVALLTTSGFSNAHSNQVFPCNQPVNPRDALYIHGNGSGSAGFTIDCLVSVEEE